MEHTRHIIIITLVSIFLPLQAQQYCGPDNKFLFQIENDTLAKGAFLTANHTSNMPFQDIRLTTKGDTVFLNSDRPHRITWFDVSEEEAENIEKKQSGIPVIVKLFNPVNWEQKTHTEYYSEYYMWNEHILILDNTSNEIVLPFLIKDDYVIVVKKYGEYSRTFISEKEFPKGRRVVLSICGPSCRDLETQCIFEDFPVKITDDCIIPLNEEKNFQCWIENGFYFPEMHRKTNTKQPIQLINWLSIGYQGLMGVHFGQSLNVKKENGYQYVTVDTY